MNLISKIIYRIQLRQHKLGGWRYLTTMLKMLNPNDIDKTSKHINLKKLGLIIELNTFSFLLSAYDYAISLYNLNNVEFKIDKSKLYIKIDNLKFEIQTAEEIFILKEIFIDGVYNFKTFKPMENYVVIDIGMNVAFASSYFASIKNVSKVISYEPFKPTFNQAITNINLNKLNEKIEAINFGLGNKDQILEVEYTPEFRGQVGIQGVESIKSNITNTQKESIEIKDALPIFQNIVKEYKENRFVLKIDCEGAEYDLISRIPDSMLQRTDIIMMEWHIKGPKVIEDWLNKNGFSYFSFNPVSQRVGMIYAIKN